MKHITLTLSIVITTLFATAQQPATPDAIYGQLFTDVQVQKVFEDGKTFVDCIPKRKVKDIMYDYGMQKAAGMNIKKFILQNFEMPPAPPVINTNKEADGATHIKNLWSNLKRKADAATEGSSLLPLPGAYIVPGGRFREIYYWDSYFTMLGLKESGEIATIENMIKNFAFLIDKYGHIPNGNRSYYLSRSQPPFFSLMIELLASIKGNTVYKTYARQLEKEYQYWMDKTAATKHVATMPDGSILNRYYDRDAIPRQESHKEDYETAQKAIAELAMRIRMASPEAVEKMNKELSEKIYRNLRSGAESGWDFSSRWFSDETNISSIQTTSIIPVDLNCLLYHLETSIAKAKTITKDVKGATAYKDKAAKRKSAILNYCWNAATGFFFDYNTEFKQQQANITAAGMYPLFVKIATPQQATTAAAVATKYLLKPGGIVTTTSNTGQQWDAPNGWAPLQWVAVSGLQQYGQTVLAKDIAQRWLAVNDKVYAATGKFMEKYNVEDLTKEAGGGEYPSQDGFGWTNGVYLAMKKLLQ
jgi:alpha,alpha-trehalase